MIPIIYYAHSMEIYNTDRELEELERLQAFFYNGLIYNPNNPYIQYSSNPMAECFKIIKDQTITGVAFSHNRRRIPSGVCGEIRAAQKKYKKLYRIDSNLIVPYYGVVKMTKKDRATDWARV